VKSSVISSRTFVWSPPYVIVTFVTVTAQRTPSLWNFLMDVQD